MKINSTVSSCLLGIACITLSYCAKDDQVRSNHPAPATAHTESLLWNGDAALGASNVWKVLNIEGSGTITVATDPVYGPVWQFYKPAGSHRTEGHGAKNFAAAEGDDIYLGWRSKLVIPANQNTNAVFQWKAYGSGQPMLQNFPIVLSTTTSGKFHLMHYAPGKIGTEVWQTNLLAAVWNDIVMRIKVSRDSSIGFIEFWYNGTKQTLVNGTQRYYARTWDADYCDPKWGVYGGDAADITNFVHGLKIGSTYGDAAPTSVPALQTTLYQNCSYGGWAASFGPGSYNSAALTAAGAVNNDASSLKVPAGLRVTLFDGDNFTGDSLVITADASCIKNTSTMNDKASSMIVGAL
ncbi:Polysaccharide lyase [Chitinophaga jiangningensis]|uniref:Polysaccharide lyase n=1 Tax=Chitinophaga jiangningensis TaxID=1419482 RepID=A0A1M7CZ73_9BACT|nr:heparin lyase I family protein [Chitinophaga jiangningensis]SHL72417.1 Polysaccharide lyase [Chitinophaga jiangningensis]